MKRIENHCCGCAVPGYPCMGKYCPNTSVPVYYCDKCGSEIYCDEVYEVDEKDLCEDCLKEIFKKDLED